MIPEYKSSSSSSFYAEMNSELNEKDALGPKRLISTNV